MKKATTSLNVKNDNENLHNGEFLIDPKLGIMNEIFWTVCNRF